jgi:hypothetical protein
MHHSFAIFIGILGAYAILLLLAIICFLVVVIRTAMPATRDGSIRYLKVGLLGGLVFTSSTFWWFAVPLVGTTNFIFTGNQYLQSNVFGWSKWYPHWLPDFLFGFMLAVGAIALFRKLKSKSGRSNAL